MPLPSPTLLPGSGLLPGGAAQPPPADPTAMKFGIDVTVDFGAWIDTAVRLGVTVDNNRGDVTIADTEPGITLG